jgi:hypothetical protein
VKRRFRSKSVISANLLIAVAATALLGVAGATTLSGFSAQIVNATSTFQSGTMQLEESSGVLHCYSTGSGSGGTVSATNSAVCTTISDLSSAVDQYPGSPAHSVNITIKNVGNLNANHDTLVFGTCAYSKATDDANYYGADAATFCSKVNLSIQKMKSTGSLKTGGCTFPASATPCPASPTNAGNLAGAYASFGATGLSLTALTAGSSATYRFTVMLTPTTTNAYQGVKAAQQITWNQS